MYLNDLVDLLLKDNLVIPYNLGWVLSKDLQPFNVNDPEC